MKLPLNGFDLAYGTIFLPAAAMVLYKQRRYGKYVESASALIGAQLKDDAQNPLFRNGTIWVHAVSVGEVIAAKAMLPLLKNRFPETPILLTTHTETGQQVARDLPSGMADVVRYMPVDFSWLMRRAVSVWRPKIFIPMETELWPNALSIISQSGARVFTLNGKISEKSFRSYQRIRPLIQKPLSCVTAFCVQTDADANRISTLLGRSDNIHVTGNCKFDVEIPPLDDVEKKGFADKLGLSWPARYIVAGSTHPGEEKIILDAYSQVLKSLPDLKFILVPRHPERFPDVWQNLQATSLSIQRTSDRQQHGAGSPTVYLVDQMGLLTKLYALAEVALVAGSFVEGIGGHNLLEPAAHGVPVVYGPYMKSQPDMVRIMTAAEAGTQTPSSELHATLMNLLTSPDEAHARGRKGQQAYQANRGSAERNMQVINKYLK